MSRAFWVLGLAGLLGCSSSTGGSTSGSSASSGAGTTGGSTSAGSSTGAASTSAGSTGAASTSAGSTGSSGNANECCSPVPASTGGSGGSSTGAPFPFQDFATSCDATGSDGGCASLSVSADPHRLGPNCPLQFQHLAIHGVVQDGSIVGVVLPVNPDGGGLPSADFAYTSVDTEGGSTGTYHADRGTVTFAEYDAVSGHAAGAFQVHFDNAWNIPSDISGAFDTAAVDCTCPSCQ